jgi:hypothetical protein
MAKSKSDGKAQAKPKHAAEAGNPYKVADILQGYNRGLKKVPAHMAFITHDCRRIYNLFELAYALEEMDSGTFAHHVSESNNDFYNWIKDAIKDNELAVRIWKDKTSNDMAATVAERILEHADGSSSNPKEGEVASALCGMLDRVLSGAPPDFNLLNKVSYLTEGQDLVHDLEVIILKCDIEEASKRHRMLESIKPLLLSSPSEEIKDFISKLDSMKSEDTESYKMFDEFYSFVESAATRGMRSLIASLNKAESRLDEITSKVPEIFESARRNLECYGHEFRDNDGKTINIFANGKMYDDPVYQQFCDQFRKIIKQMLKDKVDAARMAAEEAKDRAKKEHRKDIFSAVYSALVVPIGIFGFGSLSVSLWADYVSSLPEKIAAFSIPAVAGGIVVGSLPYLAKKAYRLMFGPSDNPEDIFKPRIGPGYKRIKVTQF